MPYTIAHQVRDARSNNTWPSVITFLNNNTHDDLDLFNAICSATSIEQNKNAAPPEIVLAIIEKYNATRPVDWTRRPLLHAIRNYSSVAALTLIKALSEKGADTLLLPKGPHDYSPFQEICERYQRYHTHKHTLIYLLGRYSSVHGESALYKAEAAAFWAFGREINSDYIETMCEIPDTHLYAKTLTKAFLYELRPIHEKKIKEEYLRTCFNKAGIIMLVGYLENKLEEIEQKKKPGKHEAREFEKKVVDFVALTDIIRNHYDLPRKHAFMDDGRKNLSGWVSNKYVQLREAFYKYVLKTPARYDETLEQLDEYLSASHAPDSTSAKLIEKLKASGLQMPEKREAAASSSATTATALTAAPVATASAGGASSGQGKKREISPGIKDKMEMFQ